jgi:hypothetical protein
MMAWHLSGVIPDCRDSGKSGIHNPGSVGVSAEILSESIVVMDSGSSLCSAPE